MISRVSGVPWMDENREGDDSTAPSSWANMNAGINIEKNQNQNHPGFVQNKDEMGSLCALKPMLEIDEDWYMANNGIQNQSDIIRDITFSPNFADQDSLLLNPVDSSTPCSPSTTVFNNLDPSQVPYFLPHKPNLSSLLNVVPGNTPLDHGFGVGCDVGFLEPQASSSSLLRGFTDFSSNNNQIILPNLCSDPQVPMSGISQVTDGSFTGFRGFEEGPGKPLFLSRPKILRPLESLPPSGAQPTLFQKRVAFRKKLANNDTERDGGKIEIAEGNERKRKMACWEEMEDASLDGSALNYDSDELTENRTEENGKNGGNSSNVNSTVTGGDGGDKKGKKKGMPAKNLMAERRRRKKLNDRLYMLRSVVPKISKMDRASILGDAIEYLKELLQRINDIHNELESGSSLSTPSTTSFHPLTPTPAALPNRIKDELCPSSMPSPNGQPARIEVRVREGKAVNIHMFCGRKPGLLLSTMKALDSLGLELHQAVISCFNGFAMDIFRAEQWRDGQDALHPDQIKAALLESAGYHGVI
ncbi:transcription factor ICE1-like [Prosopis cineraria]|uniref:transcription factor ICE1-like n=1 Tax=Prosopis cineraria TaxID=364024 RepID=UPI00240F26FA|nr:transcription factor ICE1-like [Prosopis cineraria]